MMFLYDDLNRPMLKDFMNILKVDPLLEYILFIDAGWVFDEVRFFYYWKRNKYINIICQQVFSKNVNNINMRVFYFGNNEVC